MKRIFKFKKYDLEMANKMVESIRNAYKALKRKERMDDVTVVTIHVRLTDYKRHLKLLFNLEPIKSTWFSTAMQYFCDKYKVRNYQVKIWINIWNIFIEIYIVIELNL